MRALLLTITSFILASSLSFGLKVTWTDVVYDNNGNVTELLDGETGDIIGSYKYDPYGNTIDIQGEAAYENKVRFSTKEVDSSGLYYYGYRYYNPQDGRWLNRDPIEEQGGQNLYGMVGNNSITKYDVLGMFYLEIPGEDIETLTVSCDEPPCLDCTFTSKISWTKVFFHGVSYFTGVTHTITSGGGGSPDCLPDVGTGTGDIISNYDDVQTNSIHDGALYHFMNLDPMENRTEYYGDYWAKFYNFEIVAVGLTGVMTSFNANVTHAVSCGNTNDTITHIYSM